MLVDRLFPKYSKDPKAYRAVLVVVDGYFRYTTAYHLHLKNAFEVNVAVKRYITWAERKFPGHNVQQAIYDGGGEFVNDVMIGYLEGEAGYKIYFPTMRVVQHVMHAFLKEDIVYGDPYSDGYDTLLSEWLSKQSDSCSDDDNEKESIHMEDEEDESIISQEESMHSQDEVMLSGNELEDESIPK
ncbi:unnamed protein product [Peronospora belbahrii]|uniref:Integrase catalytic domain-containing protein n=1 Tax=Peronospora belbahrii TaxID=622444 RepID=A0ABN8DCI0_9STRA|nr:unnamed protein product [Peronospora belbahrii]